ncbi:MAG: hypothetical protein HGA19_20050 [Oscillochloris sp.]|nr:hypothetical protein [Oscillochloris sp.]
MDTAWPPPHEVSFLEAFLVKNPVWVGVLLFVLMSLDRVLTIAQQREVTASYGRHYRIYPTNTIEGNPALQSSVQRAQYLSPKHLVLSVILSGAVAWVTQVIPDAFRVVFLGYILGIFLLVNTQHLSNLLGYRLGRSGVHGAITIHQRTALKTQSARYFAWFVLMLLLASLTWSPFLVGVAGAAIFSSLRQLLWLRTVPQFDAAIEAAIDKP